MDRRDFIAMFVAVGAVCSGLNAGCSKGNQENTANKIIPQNTNSNTSTPKNASNSPGNVNSIQNSGDKVKEDNSIKDNLNNETKNTPTPEEEEASPVEYGTVIVTPSGATDQCIFKDGTTGPCYEENGKWYKSPKKSR